MKRLFTFGCSFTSWPWPTWADILGHEFDQFENWGQIGGGNQFIFNSLIECLVKNKLSADDQVIIMWTNVAREDRYVNGKWLTPGNIYTQGDYDSEFVKKYADSRGYLLRDLAVIYAAEKLLERYQIPYIFTSIVPLDNADQYESSKLSGSDDIIYTYRDTVNKIRPSAYEIIFNFDWGSRQYHNRTDAHPTPDEYLEYIEKILPEFTIDDSTKIWANEITNRIMDKASRDMTWYHIDNKGWEDLFDPKSNKPDRW